MIRSGIPLTADGSTSTCRSGPNQDSSIGTISSVMKPLASMANVDANANCWISPMSVNRFEAKPSTVVTMIRMAETPRVRAM